MKYNRREFLKTGGAVLACTCLGGLSYQSCSPFGSVSDTAIVPRDSYRIEDGQIVIALEKMKALSQIGGAARLKFLHPKDRTLTKIIVIHPEATSYQAFANHCQHNGKDLAYDHPAKQLRCVSRHSEFDINGNVLKGNADKPLMRYKADLEGDTLIVKI